MSENLFTVEACPEARCCVSDERHYENGGQIFRALDRPGTLAPQAITGEMILPRRRCNAFAGASGCAARLPKRPAFGHQMTQNFQDVL